MEPFFKIMEPSVKAKEPSFNTEEPVFGSTQSNLLMKMGPDIKAAEPFFRETYVDIPDNSVPLGGFRSLAFMRAAFNR